VQAQASEHDLVSSIFEVETQAEKYRPCRRINGCCLAVNTNGASIIKMCWIIQLNDGGARRVLYLREPYLANKASRV